MVESRLERKARIYIFLARQTDHPIAGRYDSRAGSDFSGQTDGHHRNRSRSRRFLIYSAGLLKAMGIENGRVIGVDIEIRPHNRKAIEEHFLFPYITLIEGSSTAPEIVEQVKALVEPDDIVMVILDSNHLRGHVLDELEAYCELVTKDSYIVATDGIMQEVYRRAARHGFVEHGQSGCRRPRFSRPTSGIRPGNSAVAVQ